MVLYHSGEGAELRSPRWAPKWSHGSPGPPPNLCGWAAQPPDLGADHVTVRASKGRLPSCGAPMAFMSFQGTVFIFFWDIRELPLCLVPISPPDHRRTERGFDLEQAR